MLHKILCFLSLFIAGTLSAQLNLVPNPSFELTGSSTNPNFPVQNWDRPPGSGTTPDAFHTTYAQGTDCAGNRGIPQNGMGYSNALSGNGYVGFLLFYNQGNQKNSREYIQTQLLSPLIAGQNYRIGMFFKKSPRSSYALNHFGIYLSDTAIHQVFNQPISSITPQLDLTGVFYDTTNWTLMQKIYTAVGGESYLTIGNFYVDTACSIIYTGQYDPWCWLNVNAGYHYIDSVFVLNAEPNAVDNEWVSPFNMYPNPANDYLHLQMAEKYDALKMLTLYDAIGRKIREMNFVETETTLLISDLPKGYYVIELQIAGKNYHHRFCKE